MAKGSRLFPGALPDSARRLVVGMHDASANDRAAPNTPWQPRNTLRPQHIAQPPTLYWAALALSQLRRGQLRPDDRTRRGKVEALSFALVPRRLQST